MDESLKTIKFWIERMEKSKESNNEYNQGYKQGYINALQDVENLLKNNLKS